MSLPFQNQLDEAMAELAEKRAALAEIQQRMRDTTHTVTSRRRIVAVTVDSAGVLVSVKFTGTGYRSLPPAELEQLLVETIDSARQQAVLDQAEAMRPLLSPDTPVDDMLSGTFDLDEMVEKAVRLVSEAAPAGGRGPAADSDGEV